VILLIGGHFIAEIEKTLRIS